MSSKEFTREKNEKREKNDKRDRGFRRDRDKDSRSNFSRNSDSRENTSRSQEDVNENLVEGRNPVIELLKSQRTIEKLYVAKGASEGSIKLILSMARDKGIVISEVDRKKLDDMCTTGNHQGVIAIASPYVYSTVEEIIEAAKERNEDPFIIILDEIEDPHNLGSIVRTANVCGAHGVIIPKRRSASVTATVSKASAGAIEYTKIAKVTNLNQTIKELKDNGIWVIGTDMDGTISYETNLKGPVALIVGSEGKGISRLVKENCDMVVRIPMKGEINSLNASVAAGIVMYEILKQRNV